jgi:hypothetical protein
MKKTKVAIVVGLFLTAGWGALSLAKPPGGGGGGTPSCNRVVCAQCPEGYVLAKPAVWPNCCVCVPAP